MSGVDRMRLLLEQGVADQVFPGAQAVVFLRGRVVFEAHVGAATASTVFDLASLTKIISTTAVFMKLWNDGQVGPETRIERFVPEAPVGVFGGTLGDLLAHRSGLPAFVPFFADALRAHPALLDPACPPQIRAQAASEVMARAVATQTERAVAKQAVYSDVGFILLGEVLQRVAQRPLDELFESLVAGPLGLEARFHRLSRFSPELGRNVAPTGRTRPREPAPGQESLWAPFPKHATRIGEVDDDNAFVLDGVAGHAGLFGTAMDAARFGQAVLEELNGKGVLAPDALWARAVSRDTSVPHSTRALGFDTPSEGSSAGHFIGDTPPGAAGHLGFTGTSLWIDRARALVVALTSNRTYNGRANVRIRDFRPRFHDAVVQALGLEALHG